MGIELEQEWLATLDGRTRHSHRQMDGQHVKVGEVFSNGCKYPGDPDGPGREIWNCRCTLIPRIEGVDNTSAHANSKLGNMTYNEWKYSHVGRDAPMYEGQVATIGHRIAQGKNISTTWERRPDQFAFEIEDVINAQGFDGLPRVVSQEEFDAALAKNGIICKRGYTAPDAETLSAYENALYNGKWYVDCSSGGASYGQGMYAVGSFGTELTQHMDDVVSIYARAEHGKVETFTMQNPTVINSKNINAEKQLAIYETRKSASDVVLSKEQDAVFKLMNGVSMTDNEREYAFSAMGNPDNTRIATELFAKAASNKKISETVSMIGSLDDGVFAAMRGYDAVQVDVDSSGGKYFVVLNRTKCIFLGG